MRLSLAFAALVAIVPAFANVIPPRIGKAIPLSKRAVQITDHDGVVNRRTLNSLRTRTVRKFGRDAMRVATDVCGRDSGSGVDPLINEQNGFWHGKISVGNPPVDFTVDFSTSSSQIILAGPNCGATCQGHKIYDPAASSTAKDLDKPFTFGFTDGSSFQGEVFTDTVVIAGLTVTNQPVGAASRYPVNYTSDKVVPDGFMGMGFSEGSVFGTNTFFENLIAQDAVVAPQFSFKLAADESELFLGGSNAKLFTGEFTTVNVTEVGFWQIDLDAVNVGGRQAIAATQAVIDIGTSFIGAPEPDVVKLYKAIPGSKNIGQGYFTFPCNTDPQVSLTLGGKEFLVPAGSFNFGQITQGSMDCIGGIIALIGIDHWVVGDNLLSHFYTRFDVEKKQVGFAALA